MVTANVDPVSSTGQAIPALKARCPCASATRQGLGCALLEQAVRSAR